MGVRDGNLHPYWNLESIMDYPHGMNTEDDPLLESTWAGEKEVTGVTV